jgi:t-SNARE complex subunit (syntaxin)
METHYGYTTALKADKGLILVFVISITVVVIVVVVVSATAVGC